jgi:two-component system, NtrC family, sensor kinase
MFYSIRSKLIVSFLGVALLVGTVSLIVGGQLIYDSVVSEVSNRVRQDLNVARFIYDTRSEDIGLALETLSLGTDFETAVSVEENHFLRAHLEQVADRIGLDFAGIVRPDGTLLCRIGPHQVWQMDLPWANPVAEAALHRKKRVAGTVVLDEAVLRAENPELVPRARMPSAGAAPQVGETAGLSIAAAVPVMQSGNLMGVVYGGKLLNREDSIVDTIGGTVFHNEVYQGRSVGTATIFFNDRRIATNVRREDGERAIGTLAAPNVTRRVLIEGEQWIDRALVVGDWYITAYEPIRDIFDQRVGMLYVGILEAKYADVRQAALRVFAGITLAGVGFALLVGLFLADRIVRPINRLIQASIKISEGNLSPDIGQISKGDFGLLQKEFQKMTLAIQEREKRQKEESECQLIESGKQAMVGRLAAGVAHEINNPLTAVLTFTHLTLRRDDLPAEVRADLEMVSLQTERVRKIVKGLLDFSRQTRPELEPVDLNRLLADWVRLMENQALVQGVDLHFEQGAELPTLTLDRNQFQSVIVNMIINALDATEAGGTVTVSSRRSLSAQPGVEIIVQDTGSGITPPDMERLFDPFFTTKEVGKGTGLGLSVSAGIVDRHGGRISIRSAVGEGSTFTIWLPVQGDEQVKSTGNKTQGADECVS